MLGLLTSLRLKALKVLDSQFDGVGIETRAKGDMHFRAVRPGNSKGSPVNSWYPGDPAGNPLEIILVLR